MSVQTGGAGGVGWVEGGFLVAYIQMDDITGQLRETPPLTLPRTGQDDVQIIGGNGSRVRETG